MLTYRSHAAEFWHCSRPHAFILGICHYFGGSHVLVSTICARIHYDLDAFALFFTGTRGTELGLIGGAILATLLYTFFQGSRRMRGIAVTTVVVVAVLAGGLCFAHNTALLAGRLSRSSGDRISLSDDTVYARLLNMEWL